MIFLVNTAYKLLVKWTSPPMKTATLHQQKSHFAGLDGLRAIAVMAVIFYHLNISGFFSGGFLGVDIFFTLSGFLITRLLLNEQESNNSINLKKFYIHRFHRLAPAMLGVIGICSLIVPIVAPDAASQLGKDIVAALLYCSNWWQVFSEQSYFEMMNRPPLLQHLWSLAIEEQFYFLWPIILVISISRFGRLGLLLVAGLLTFSTASWMAFLAIQANIPLDADPNRLYLGTDTHTSGLFAGAMLACLWNPWHFDGGTLAKLRSPRIALLLGSCGLATLFALFIWANETQSWLYRGGFIFVAFLTSITIIAVTTPNSFYTRILGVSVMRYIGQRSYGLYLWHWPIFVLLRPQDFILPEPMTQILRLFTTLLVAEISFQCIETPLRRDGFKVITTWNTLKKSIYVFTVAISIIMTVNLMINAKATDDSANIQLVTTASPNNLSPRPLIPPPSSCSDKNCTTTTTNPESLATSLTSSADMLALGDSVMLGAQSYLQRGLPGVWIDAKVGRQGRDAIRLIRQLRADNQLPSSILIHIGTNGYLPNSAFRELMTELADRKRIILVNIRANRRWMADNNKLLTEFQGEKYKNVTFVDWAKTSEAHPEYFVSDGIHLTGGGIHAYVDAIRHASGIQSDFLTSSQLAATKTAATKLTIATKATPKTSHLADKLAETKPSPSPMLPNTDTQSPVANITNTNNNQTSQTNTEQAINNNVSDSVAKPVNHKESTDNIDLPANSAQEHTKAEATTQEENDTSTDKKEEDEANKQQASVIDDTGRVMTIRTPLEIFL